MRFQKIACVIAGLLSAVGASSAQAAVVFSDDFEAYAPNSVPWDGGGSWTTGNSVDLIQSGSFNLTCAGGAGKCVDLSGDTAGSISKGISLAAGKYFLSFDATGNQLDGIGGTWPQTSFTATIGGVTFNTGTLANNTNVFQTFTTAFTVATAGTYALTFAQNAGGNNFRGSILDNVSISAAPEPSSWLLMIVGVGMIGGALRRRRQIGQGTLTA